MHPDFSKIAKLIPSVYRNVGCMGVIFPRTCYHDGQTKHDLPRSSATIKIMCGGFPEADGEVRKYLAPVIVRNNNTTTEQRRRFLSI